MNAEYNHQLYGGEISDHFTIQGKTTPSSINPLLNNDQKLGDIYSAQVKPVGQVAITKSATNMNVNALIEHQPDPLVQQLQDTLAKIAQDFALTPDSKVDVNFKPTLKDQSADDINQANDAVMKALEELKALGEM